jgi:arginase
MANVIEIIGAPFDLCGKRPGSRLGPAALRIAGLRDALEQVGCAVLDGGDLPGREEHTEHGGLRNFEPLLATLIALRERVSSALEGGRLPVVLGGDHALGVGGVSAALDHFEGDLAILWIDAHADLNTPATSPSGNLHGMPVAALLGLNDEPPHPQWSALLEATLPVHRLAAHRAAWIGLRDVDVAERNRMGGLQGCFPSTMQDVDRHGLIDELERFDLWLRRSSVRHLWISFDVDALDPYEAPGTGTAVRGGLSYREAHLLAEILRELLDEPQCPYRLVGVDVMETNPLQDRHNETARVAVEWIASLFGKTILGRPGVER